MLEAAKIAAKLIEGYKKNTVIMEFVTNEALEKTASDIREKTGSGTTAKAISLLRIKNEEIEARVQEYIYAGLVGVLMAASAKA